MTPGSIIVFGSPTSVKEASNKIIAHSAIPYLLPQKLFVESVKIHNRVNNKHERL